MKASPIPWPPAIYSARLAPPRLYLQTQAGIQVPQSGRGRRYWVVARNLCLFFRISLPPAASLASQREILALETKRLSPFSVTGSHFDLCGDHAAIWVWDGARAEASASAIGLDIARLRVVPETALQPSGDDGVRLVETLEGREGQFWSAGSLSASRWWPQMPDQRGWLLFQRGASVPAEQIDTTVPAAVPLNWLSHPWTRAGGHGLFNVASIDIRIAATAAAAVMLLAYAYQGAQLLRLNGSAARLGEAIAQRSQAIEPILNARTQALENQTAIQGLHALDAFPSQLTLMARVTEALPKDATQLTGWTFDHGQLELTLASERPLDVVQLVRSLESIEHFKGVAAERTGTDNSLRLRVTLEPL